MLCLVNKLSNNDHQIKRVQSLISSSLSSLLPLLFLNLLPFLFYTDKLNPWAYQTVKQTQSRQAQWEREQEIQDPPDLCAHYWRRRRYLTWPRRQRENPPRHWGRIRVKRDTMVPKTVSETPHNNIFGRSRESKPHLTLCTSCLIQEWCLCWWF